MASKRRGRKARTVVRTVTRRVNRRSAKGFGMNLISIVRIAVMALGANALGNVAGQKFGVNPLIPALIIGFALGKVKGALLAVAMPFIIQALQTGNLGGILNGGGRAEVPRVQVLS